MFKPCVDARTQVVDAGVLHGNRSISDCRKYASLLLDGTFRPAAPTLPESASWLCRLGRGAPLEQPSRRAPHGLSRQTCAALPWVPSSEMPRRGTPDPLAQAVGARIRQLRQEAGLTIEKLAY